jgi:peptidyl-Asp metalloendopeptidase
MLAAIAGWGMFYSASPKASPVILSAELTESVQTAGVQPDLLAVRSRYITIDFDALPGPLPRGRVAREPDLPLQLFPDIFINAVFDRFEPNAGGMSWVGHVEGVGMSNVTLVYRDGLLAGNIVMPGRVYSIRPAPAPVRLANPQPGRELHLVTQVNQTAFPREAPPIEVTFSSAEIAAADAPLQTADPIVDLLVLYTPTVLTNVGGLTALTNLINLGLSDTNTSYVNSDIAQRVRLVGTSQIDFAETGAFSTSLNAVRAGTGVFSGVPAMRDALRADLVMLLVHPVLPDACGIGFLMTSVTTAFAPSGYNVVDSSCIANSTFAHELGHNMGHDWYVDSSVTPFSYAHGFVNPTPGQRWRTIMAYPDLCSDQSFSCTRLLYWANPNITYLPYCTGRGFDCGLLKYWFFPGAPMGVPGGTRTSCTINNLSSFNCDADDHRALNNTAATVANFR